MNRKQYMEKLNMDLEGMDQQSRLEIIQDFDAHFQQGLQEGKTEEEIAEELGDLDILTKELKSNEPVKSKTSSNEKNDIREVEINGLCADLTIRESGDNQVHVQFYDQRDPLRRLNFDLVTEQYDSLYKIQVKTKKSTLLNLFNFGENLRLDVQLPRSVVNMKAETASGDIFCDYNCNKMFVKALSGDVKCSQLECEELFVETVSGDCTVDITKTEVYSVKVISGDSKIICNDAQKGKISTVSGDIEYCGDTKEIAVDTKAGDVTLKLVDAQSCRVKILSGDLSLTLPKDAGFECIYSALADDFKTKLKGYVTKENKIYSYQDGRVKMVIETLSGDVLIKE